MGKIKKTGLLVFDSIIIKRASSKARMGRGSPLCKTHVIYNNMTTKAQEDYKTVVSKHSSFANDWILFLFMFYMVSHFFYN